jgi:hypothetical protein
MHLGHPRQATCLKGQCLPIHRFLHAGSKPRRPDRPT